MLSFIISGPAPNPRDIHLHFHDDNADMMENGQDYAMEKYIPDETDTIGDHKVIYPDPDFHPRYAPTIKPVFGTKDCPYGNFIECII